MKKLSELLRSHDVAQMPKEILFLSIATTLVLDILSFSIKGAQTALENNLVHLALILMLLFFIRHFIKSSVQTYTDNLKNQFNTQSDSYITNSITNISNVVRGKVFCKKADHSMIMTNAEVIFNLKEFVDHIWSLLQNFPILIANSITAFVLSIAILATEFLQTKD